MGLIGFTVPDKGRSNAPHRQGGRNRAPSFFVRESHLGIRGGLHDGICATARCTIKQGSNCLRTTKKRITPRRSLGHFRALLRVPEKCRKMANNYSIFADLQFCPAPLATQNPCSDEKSSNAMAFGCDCNEENRALDDYFLYTTDKNRIFIKISCNFGSNLL